MALISCPECGHRISDKAVSCPSCGFPVQKFLSENPSHLAENMSALKCKKTGGTLEADEVSAKRTKKISSIILSVICTIIVFVGIWAFVIIPNGKYNDAIALMDAQQYTEAIAAFETIEGYKDSIAKIDECNVIIAENNYNDAIRLMEDGRYDEAISVFEVLGEYKDSKLMISDCKYMEANLLMEAEQYREAIKVFNALDGHKDSAAKIDECNALIIERDYNDAVWLMDTWRYEKAIAAFQALEGYKDSEEKIEECKAILYATKDAKFDLRINWHGHKLKPEKTFGNIVGEYNYVNVLVDNKTVTDFTAVSGNPMKLGVEKTSDGAIQLIQLNSFERTNIPFIVTYQGFSFTFYCNDDS